MLLLCTIGTLIIILALLILFHHNFNATKGYRLRSLEHVRNQLLLQQEVLNMEISRAQALATLQGDSQLKTMVKPKNFTYVQGEASVTTASTAEAGR